MRSGNIADGIIIVNRVDARRELQGKLSKDMRSGPVLVRLRLVFQTGELPFEPRVPMLRLVHRTIAAHDELTLVQRCEGESHPEY